MSTRAPTVETDQVRPFLTPPQLVLFRQLQPFEQRHAFKVLSALMTSGQKDPDLLKASLLHDIGKIHYPLSIWERVLIVVMKRIFPGLAQKWGQETPQGLSKPFVVAFHHAEWGADLAARAGTTKFCIDLIRRHEDSPLEKTVSRKDRLLLLLQQADDSN